MRRFYLSVALFFALAVGARGVAAGQSYSNVSIDGEGRLHITLQSGTRVLAPLLKDQVSFDSAAVSPDHRTIGWVALFPDAADGIHASPLAGALVLYREGRILRRFKTDQVFWDWRFVDNHKVAYSIGPTHGGAAECVLRNVETGTIVARWVVADGSTPPGWAQALRR